MKKWISLLLGLVVLISATVVIHAAVVQGGAVGSYHVYYDGGADGVTGLPSDSGDYTTGSTVTVKDGAPVRDGFEFLEWIASTGVTYAGGDELTITDSDVIFYARWDGGPEPVVNGTLTYVFNNVRHSNYSGPDYSADASQSYIYTLGSTQTIKDLEAVFPDYIKSTESCEFLGWSTPPGITVEYPVNGQIVLIGDTTLYGVWKSCNPTVNDIRETNDTVTGFGVSGSAILVTFPDGSQVTAIVASSGTWLVNVPLSVSNLNVDEVVSVNQTETGKAVSDSTNATVIGNLEPSIVEPDIDVYVENLTTGKSYAQAGDLLLYDSIVSNNGTASSNWQSAYVTFNLDELVTLQVSSIRINNRAVTSDQYTYNSTANTLTLYLGDIIGGGYINISFRVVVNSDIGDIQNSVLNAELGSRS